MALYWVEGLRSTFGLVRRTWSEDERERTVARWKIVLNALILLSVVPPLALCAHSMSDFVSGLPTKLGATIVFLALSYPFSALTERTVYEDKTRTVSWLDLDPLARSAVQHCMVQHMAVIGAYVTLGGGVAALNHEDEISGLRGGVILGALLLAHIGLATIVCRRARHAWDQHRAMSPACRRASHGTG